MKKLTLAISLTIFSTQTFAMFCPNGFNSINVGDTIAQVIQQCGKPEALKTDEVPPEQPQEWSYYVKPDPTQPGTLKMTVAFDSTKKVVNITVNNQSLINTTICGGTGSINIGDTTDQVKAVCGKAGYINKGQLETPGPPINTKITTLKYGTSPTTTLIFENGFLKQRTQS